MESTYSNSFSGNNYAGVQIGHNSGTFTTIVQPRERPESPPSPLSTVPFPRDRQFVGRGKEIDELDKKTTVPGSRAALVGLGGVGKSQIAIEYSYRVRCQSAETWIFWIHANNADRFKQSFRDVAGQAKIPGRQDPNVNILELVRSWLCDRKRKWILILDNTDDDTILRKPGAVAEQETQINSQPNAAITQPLLNFIPQSSNGSVIVTSRTKEIALRIVGHDDIIWVEPMETSEALLLFQRKLGLQEDSIEAQQLVKELDFLPLAIAQAAGYIRHRAPRCTISQYLDKLRRSDRDAIRLLDRRTSGSSGGWEIGHLSRDWEAENLILRTWTISFEHIRDTRVTAADLLSLMSFFDRQGISESLLREGPEDIEKNSSDEDEDCLSRTDIDQDFEDDILTLTNYSFISITDDGTQFMMHRLVQLSVRRWLTAHNKIEHWKERFINCLCLACPPNGTYGSWAIFRSLYPHIKCAMLQPPGPQEFLLRWATLLANGADYASRVHMNSDAKEMASKSRNCRIGFLGEQHGESLMSTLILARGYSNEGQWDEAEKLQAQVVEISKIYYGESYPGTLMSMSYLASTLYGQGQWDKAERLHAWILDILMMKLVEDYPSTLDILGHLASTLYHQSQWDKAKELQKRILDISKITLGEHHPHTLQSMSNLALTFYNQGQWDKAEKLQIQVLEISKTTLGEDHPNILPSKAVLAHVWKALGRVTDAIDLLKDCLAMEREIIGVNNPYFVKDTKTLHEWEIELLDDNV